ncbi:Multidrug resistance-associated protein 1 [Mortierella polycephala]|uniref:Multidrug resistance-associated protein 1 n=1 Tax=Mortierella polycephala TaxID=41804 RepID=A0A9P6U8J8_9FUNG|nr:Multidrug resistance-associated protein 1 [Mortierella polycephala]
MGRLITLGERPGSTGQRKSAQAIVLNRLEHKYEIRSSDHIFSYYVAIITASLVIIHTTLDLKESQEPRHTLLITLTAILIIGFIVEAWPRGSTRVQKLGGACMYSRANLLSRLTFTFFQPIIAIGLRRQITAEDLLGQLPESLDAEAGYRRLSLAWNKKLKNRHSPSDQPSLFFTVLFTDWERLVPVLLSRVAIVLFSYSLPILLKELLSYLEDYESKPVSYGVTLAIAMFVASLFASLLNTYNRYQMLVIGVSNRSSLVAMIYRKSLRLSAGSRSEATSGEISNHMSVDADLWWDTVVSLSMWISIPMEIVIAMILLYNLLGWTMFAGVLTMLTMLPLQAWQARVFEGMQDVRLTAMDQRIRLTTEVLASMKIVKLYGWSAAFQKRILEFRQKELSALQRIGVVHAFMSIVFISSSLIISLVTFGVFALWGGPNFTPGKLTPQTVFVSMTLFSMLKGPISSLSDATTSTISVVVATRRLQGFLLREEVNEKDIQRFNRPPSNPQDPSISIVDATFSWTRPSETVMDTYLDEHTALLSQQSDDRSQESRQPTLRSINLSIKQGSLTAVVGRIGQGKSSLLSALIGDMYKLQGEVRVCGQIAYVPQQAWIMNATLKDNILFGTEYDEDKYKHVLYASGLEPDITMLPGGDMTEIGERGINLSGGQKQRVSLARATYADADIYLLDDPLSAVDAHVGKHLWDNLLGPSGLLRNKTRVLVTHGIHHLREMDQIVLLKDGMVAENGNYSELMAAKKLFYRLIKEYALLERKAHSNPKTERRRTNDNIAGVSIIADDENEQEMGVYEGSDQNDSDSIGEIYTDQESTDSETTREEFEVQKMSAMVGIISPETIKGGGVDFDVVVTYAKSARYRNALIIVSLFVLAQGCLVSTSFWLKYWIKKTKESDDNNPPSLALFLGVYALFTFVYVLLYMVVMRLALAVARIRASEVIHANLLDRILHAPIAFFDTTPLGRIINRFTSDIFSVDIRIPNKFIDVLLFGISVASTLILIIFSTPFFAILVPFLIAGIWIVQVCFLSVSRTLTRIYTASKSPVYQYFNECLGGVSTMRAMGIQERFIAKNTVLTNRMSNTFLCNMSSRRWLDVQLRLLSNTVLLCAALFAVLQREKADPSLVGLTLSFAMSITEEVTMLVRNFCDLDNQLVNMERVLEYTRLRTEAPDFTDVVLPANWPSEGRVCFQNYSTRYREGLELVLKHISVDIAAGEKVGIVGRTGAGKSSLTLALFRIVEAANSYWAKASDNSDIAAVNPEDQLLNRGNSSGEENDRSEAMEENVDGGRIEIDGVDISTVGLQELRLHLSIIPQDPTLFAGTVRDNLDPFYELEDAELWQALERSHLKDYIASLPGGLHFEVTQNGDNFSVGQRSLICLARALLKKTKILVLDEATAAVDVETDKLIQKTIRKEFKDRTILTIAHRIKTVMDSDKILVLEQGRVAEFDTPAQLLKNEESMFYKLAKQAGEA